MNIEKMPFTPRKWRGDTNPPSSPRSSSLPPSSPPDMDSPCRPRRARHLQRLAVDPLLLFPNETPEEAAALAEIARRRDELHLTLARPPRAENVRPHQMCGLCGMLKSHPVSRISPDTLRELFRLTCTRQRLLKMTKTPSKTKLAPPSTLAARRAASARNLDTVREGSRERMAILRAERKSCPEQEDAARMRARASSKKYRERHSVALAEAQRDRRVREYKLKYGAEAWEERWLAVQTQRRQAQEDADLLKYREQWRRDDAARSLASLSIQNH
ncbi:hypothetical protein R3P38DRAFT_3219427 [Favolaschia claudopus]|uniref:Uncharacterized protein n=1 Tax=Favolaschia claudopus TaxID=2862362 RepID=A0AAW0A1R0_9AGAR